MKLLSLLTIALVAALVAVGCGGSNGSDSNASSANTTTDPERGDQAAIRDCLEDHGIDLPERLQGGQGGPPADGELPEGGPPPGAGQGPPGGFPGGDNDGIRQALDDCGIEAPRGGTRTPQNNAAFKAAIQKYVRCMRSNGADLPDPNLSGNGPVFDDNDVDRQDPAFVKANRACQNHLRPNPQQQG